MTEEVAFGPGAQMLARTNPGHMHRGHDLWNISLNFLCESLGGRVLQRDAGDRRRDDASADECV